MPLSKQTDRRTDRRVDTYIEQAAPFAQPILQHLRALVHQAAPDVAETMKWRMPFFTLNGIILCNMAAFKAHCAFGLWSPAITAKLKADGIIPADAKGSNAGFLKHITARKELPSDKALLAYLRAAAAEISSGQRTSSLSRPAKRTTAKPAPAVPTELAAALKKSKPATNFFAKLPPSHRREYIEWVAEAKRAETRLQRAATAAEWLAEGKHRNWKYEQSR